MNMDFSIQKLKNEVGTIFFMLNIHKNYEWLDNYECILETLVEHCSCKLISSEFLIYIPMAVLTRAGVEFSFFHDTLDGAYLCADKNSTIAEIAEIEQIANEVVLRLREKAKQ
jgi:hypothetical protein